MRYFNYNNLIVQNSINNNDRISAKYNGNRLIDTVYGYGIYEVFVDLINNNRKNDMLYEIINNDNKYYIHYTHNLNIFEFLMEYPSGLNDCTEHKHIDISNIDIDINDLLSKLIQYFSNDMLIIWMTYNPITIYIDGMIAEEIKQGTVYPHRSTYSMECNEQIIIYENNQIITNKNIIYPGTYDITISIDENGIIDSSIKYLHNIHK